MTTNENNKMFFFNFYLERTTTKFSDFNIYLIFEF